MPAREQQHEECASHGGSLARKLAAWLVVACACTDEPESPPVDPNDVDGDGILNEGDNCPKHTNPTQHDEDGDRFGDRCDICPTVPDPLQVDNTEIDALQFKDGVGDACDPIPGRGGTKVAALHTFAVEGGHWRGDGWTIDAPLDVARATDTAMWQNTQTAPGGAVVVAARFSSVVWSGAGALTLLLDGDGVSAGMRCRILQDTDGDGSDEMEAAEIGNGEPAVMNIGMITSDEPVVLTLGRAVNAQKKGILDCIAKHGDRAATLRVMTADPTISGQYAFGSEGALSDVSSVIVYTGPQPCPDPTVRACPR